MKQRIIKFKCFDINQKKSFSFETLKENGFTLEDLEKEWLVFRQWTGLLDKNGKEIYEGDIVKHREITSSEAIIKFGLLQSMMQSLPKVVEFNHYGFEPFNGWIDDTNKELEWEIIGNIYENPELLIN